MQDCVLNIYQTFRFQLFIPIILVWIWFVTVSQHSQFLFQTLIKLICNLIPCLLIICRQHFCVFHVGYLVLPMWACWFDLERPLTLFLLGLNRSSFPLAALCTLCPCIDTNVHPAVSETFHSCFISASPLAFPIISIYSNRLSIR